MKKWIIFICSLFVVAAVIGFISFTTVEPIKVAQVVKMEITPSTVYTKDENQAEIERFVKAYNKAKRYRDDVGTTPSVDITLTLDSGEKIWIGGTTESFHIVQRHGKQFNIQGLELDSYFKSLR